MAVALKKKSSSPNSNSNPKPNPKPKPKPKPSPNLEEGVEQLGRCDGGERRHRLLHGGLLLEALRLGIGSQLGLGLGLG